MWFFSCCSKCACFREKCSCCFGHCYGKLGNCVLAGLFILALVVLMGSYFARGQFLEAAEEVPPTLIIVSRRIVYRNHSTAFVDCHFPPTENDGVRLLRRGRRHAAHAASQAAVGRPWLDGGCPWGRWGGERGGGRGSSLLAARTTHALESLRVRTKRALQINELCAARHTRTARRAPLLRSACRSA